MVGEGRDDGTRTKVGRVEVFFLVGIKTAGDFFGTPGTWILLVLKYDDFKRLFGHPYFLESPFFLSQKGFAETRQV